MNFLDIPFLTNEVIPRLTQGLIVSLWLIIPAALIGGSLGIFAGILRVFGSPSIKRIINTMVAIIRGVPLTVQLMILYFGLPNIPYLNIYLDPYSAALIGFILCTGAYQSEYIRGALLSIKQGQIKAGEALGMTKTQVICSIIVPQAIRRALPGCGNEVIYLIKYSSLAYIITCIELTGEAKIVVSHTFRPTEVYLIAGIYYLFLVTIATWLLNKLEQALRIPGFGKSGT